MKDNLKSTLKAHKMAEHKKEIDKMRKNKRIGIAVTIGLFASMIIPVVFILDPQILFVPNYSICSDYQDVINMKISKNNLDNISDDIKSMSEKCNGLQMIFTSVKQTSNATP